jgi:hypothetical protein
MARAATLEGIHHAACVVINMHPLAALLAIAINGQRLARQRIGYHARNKFFRVLARAIIIATAGDDAVQPIGGVPGTHQHIGGGFACGIGRVGRKWAGKREGAFVA